MLEELRISFETGLEPAGAALGGFGGALYDNRDPLCSTFSFLHFILVCALYLGKLPPKKNGKMWEF